jgi:hypothetical protein
MKPSTKISDAGTISDIFLRFSLLLLTILTLWLSGFSPKPVNNSTYLSILQKSAFSRYINQPAGYSRVIHSASWDAYVFSLPEYQCVMGGDFGLLTHAGKFPEKTVLWLQAGQECWPSHPNCSSGSPGRADEALAYEAVGIDGGPFGPNNADRKNPVAAWNYIYVPACNGSFYMGDAIADYDNNGIPDHFHNGLRQVSASVNLMKELFPNTREIFIFGSSTGGFGTFGAIPVARLGFPDARITVLDDSGPGIFNPQKPEIWEEIRRTWGLNSILPADCTGCTRQLTPLFGWLLDSDPNLKIGLFSSYQDSVVANVVGMDEKLYQQTLLAETDQLQKDHSDVFNRFLAKGESHTIGDFYRKVNNVTVWDWLTAMLDGSPKWQEVLQ